MKKILIFLLVTVFAVSMFFIGIGCKGETAPSQEAVEEEVMEEEAPAEVTDEPITIHFWSLAGPNNDWVVAWKNLYEAENPNVTINVTAHESQAIMDIITPALASGSEDLDLTFYWPGASIDTWARDGLLLDLSPYYEQYGWWDKKNQGGAQYLTDGAGEGGKGMFTFTTDWVTVPHYFYNTTIFEEVGIAPPETIDDLYTNAEALKAAGYEAWSAGVVDRWPVGGIFNDYLADIMPTEDFNKLVNWERDPNKSAETAEIFLHESVVEAWAFIRSLIDAGVFIEGANAMDDTAARQAFNNGITAIYDSGSWTMGIFDSEAPDLTYSYYNLPPIDGRLTICSGYNGLSIPASVSEEKIPVIMDLLDHSLLSDYSQAIFNIGAIPDNAVLTDSELEALSPHPLLTQIIKDVVEFGDVGIIDALQTPALRENYYDIIADIFEGNITPEEAAQRMYEGALEILEQ